MLPVTSLLIALTDCCSLLNPKLTGLETADSPQKVLYVHQALLDEHCRPLCDDLREHWKVFDFETVQRFALSLYNADYSYPMPVPVEVTKPPTSSVSSKPEPSPEPGASGFPTPPRASGESSATTGPGYSGASGSTNPFPQFDPSEMVRRYEKKLRYGCVSGKLAVFGFC